eukprot:1392417-Amorphochlora_amoeboformis.AAC.2
MIKDNLVRKLKSDLASNLVRLDVDGGEKLTRKESNLIKRFRKFVGDGVDLTILRYFLNQANQVLEDAIVLYFEARQDHLKKSDGLEDGKAAPTVERTANPKLEVAPGDKVRVEWAKLDGKKSCTAEVKDVNGRKLVVRSAYPTSGDVTQVWKKVLTSVVGIDTGEAIRARSKRSIWT